MKCYLMILITLSISCRRRDKADDLSETVNTTTQRVVNRKQVIFNEEAKRLDEQEALLLPR